MSHVSLNGLIVSDTKDVTTLLTYILSAVLIFSVMAQSTAPKFDATPDGFMGLTLDVTTLQETLALLGTPDNDEIDLSTHQNVQSGLILTEGKRYSGR